MISLLIIMVLITSKLALSRSIDCTTLTEEALRAKQRVVKFDTFFKDLVPMKAYVYNSLVYNFVNSKLHCTDVENHYRIRFNWTSRVGIYQLYSNLAEMCSIVTVFKDGNGNVQVRAGIEGRYSTNQYRMGFTVERKSFQRLYYLAQDDARQMVEFWLTEVPSGSAIGSGSGQNCRRGFVVGHLDRGSRGDPVEGSGCVASWWRTFATIDESIDDGGVMPHTVAVVATVESFKEDDIKDMFLLWFNKIFYRYDAGRHASKRSTNVMDVWITSFKESLLEFVSKEMKATSTCRLSVQGVAAGVCVQGDESVTSNMKYINLPIERAVSRMQAVVELSCVMRDRRTVPIKYPSKEYLDDIKSLVNFILNVRDIILSSDKQKYKQVIHAVKVLTDPQIAEQLKLGFFTVLGHRIELNELRFIYQFDEQQASGRNTAMTCSSSSK
ncbi:isoleucyl tRNA synthetase [Culex quinquefasciatus]|uniref:Isoleucyl tRNA synthetase n=1 Tax=Culex quinquefasciatus TaxID=7176 RepID=B0XB38_CULQU|nr:isoleucyl tRNA synthetase [Culex quinquefasciatus]|eukprot:XP_001866860.1 isoleucyl tRNA synthetase [Culex quinquefasciatus]